MSQADQLLRERSHPIDVSAAPPKVHPHVAAIGPTQGRKSLRERREARLPQGVVLSNGMSTPMRRTPLPCCARAASGPATAAQPRSVIVSRRLMRAIIPNDVDQAGDDLALAKKLVAVDRDLAAEVEAFSTHRSRNGLGAARP
jgi:hypothetical protein